MKIKIRLQGSKEEVEFLRTYLLKKHPGLILGAAREGTNPKYAGNQKWSSYGDIEFITGTANNPVSLKEKKRRRRK